MEAQKDQPPGDLRAGVVGCLSFLGCLVLGLVVTVATTPWAVRDEPREGAHPATGHGSAALFWWGMGGLASLAVATVAWIVCRSQVNRNPPTG